MATIKDITTLGKEGKLLEAYELAEVEMTNTPDNIWSQRCMAWALYYLIKNDVDKQELLEHLSKLSTLQLITIADGKMIFDNVVWKIAQILKKASDNDFALADSLFEWLRNYSFEPSEGYSFLLSSVLHLKQWNRLVEFIDWWDLEKLREEDYQEYHLDNGRSIMSTAEQAYINYSKALLQLGDKDKIRSFIPKIECIADTYPHMVYPGYFCGQLMMAVGANQEEILDTLIPFVRKKKNDFWAWSLLSEVYKQSQPDVSFACLLRAVHSRTKEDFLVKVRTAVASTYFYKRDYPRAKRHLEILIKFYVQNNKPLPFAVRDLMQGNWMDTTQENDLESLNYTSITNAILAKGANENIAVVTHIDKEKHRVGLIYGERKRTMVKQGNLQVKIRVGSLLKIYWLPDERGNLNILACETIEETAIQGLSYIKTIEGAIMQREGQPFAFINSGNFRCFIAPELVKQYNIAHGDTYHSLCVLDYNKKKATWDWKALHLTDSIH